MNEVLPRIAITFPDGSTDRMILNKYFSNEDDRRTGFNKCNFIGYLEKETGACIGKVSSQICLKSSNYPFVPFGGIIWIFVNVLAEQTSASQASSKFKTVPKGYERIIWEILRRSGYFK